MLDAASTQLNQIAILRAQGIPVHPDDARALPQLSDRCIALCRQQGDAAATSVASAVASADPAVVVAEAVDDIFVGLWHCGPPCDSYAPIGEACASCNREEGEGEPGAAAEHDARAAARTLPREALFARVDADNAMLETTEEFRFKHTEAEVRQAFESGLRHHPQMLEEYRRLLNNPGYMASWRGKDSLDWIMNLPFCYDMQGGGDAALCGGQLTYFAIEGAARKATETPYAVQRDREGTPQEGSDGSPLLLANHPVDVIVSLNTPHPVGQGDHGIRGQVFLVPDSCDTEEVRGCRHIFARQLAAASRFMLLEMEKGRRVGVHCTEGRNRSALTFLLTYGARTRCTFDQAWAAVEGAAAPVERLFYPHRVNTALVRANWDAMVASVRTGAELTEIR